MKRMRQHRLTLALLISLLLNPEGGENWVLGVVRRYNKDSDTHASVGIQALSLTVKIPPILFCFPKF